MALPKRRTGTGDEDPLAPAHLDRVRAILALGGVPAGDLQDGVQQVRLKLLEHRTAGREPLRDPGAWAAVAASNVAMDWHRSRRRQEGLRERLMALAPTGGAQHGGGDSHVLALAIADGLQELPPQQRQVLALRFYADLPVADIARALGVPEGTVKSRLHTAVRTLRGRLHTKEVV
ncbi:sigma-70 family RNA polymerase sigma factor [Streptomyces sp. NPDC088354]|uniref:sigma-70 family RNA polymerase sigma factor n=1 Tax=unclassified Streptomyces TaxID=2593676 RepID=UPI0029B13FAE|nr:sigma-70 family RNA polymerase sigma factor [Streptomyces sp. MI02-7b]MDX3074543.1 sigma-70 family RNA polymerase sigma factor [Streptomyces sp. MI02-7b]